MIDRWLTLSPLLQPGKRRTPFPAQIRNATPDSNHTRPVFIIRYLFIHNRYFRDFDLITKRLYLGIDFLDACFEADHLSIDQNFFDPH